MMKIAIYRVFTAISNTQRVFSAIGIAAFRFSLRLLASLSQVKDTIRLTGNERVLAQTPEMFFVLFSGVTVNLF
jgi:hypothetical protein